MWKEAVLTSLQAFALQGWESNQAQREQIKGKGIPVSVETALTNC